MITRSVNGCTHPTNPARNRRHATPAAPTRAQPLRLAGSPPAPQPAPPGDRGLGPGPPLTLQNPAGGSDAAPAAPSAPRRDPCLPQARLPQLRHRNAPTSHHAPTRSGRPGSSAPLVPDTRPHPPCCRRRGAGGLRRLGQGARAEPHDSVVRSGTRAPAAGWLGGHQRLTHLSPSRRSPRSVCVGGMPGALIGAHGARLRGRRDHPGGQQRRGHQQQPRAGAASPPRRTPSSGTHWRLRFCAQNRKRQSQQQAHSGYNGSTALPPHRG